MLEMEQEKRKAKDEIILGFSKQRNTILI